MSDNDVQTYSNTLETCSLGSFTPRPPAGNPWADTWYYYINDPKVGYFKIAFLSYLNWETTDNSQHAYLHIAHSPIDGPKKEYNYYSEELVVEPMIGDSPYAFRFEVPGVAAITESKLELQLPHVSISASLSDQHIHYFEGDNPAKSPFFGDLVPSPDPASHWFVFTLGTKSEYHYKDSDSEHHGTGLMYIERGWSSAQAVGFTYMMAVSEQAKLMLSGGMGDGSGEELWAGRLITDNHDVTFLPFDENHSATSQINSSRAVAKADLIQGDYRLKVKSEAPLSGFYNHGTPSLTVFHAENPVMKTMNATLTIELYKNEQLVENITLNQSILEFGGLRYSAAMR